MKRQTVERKRKGEDSKKRGCKPLATYSCSLTPYANTCPSSPFPSFAFLHLPRPSFSLSFLITWICPGEFWVPKKQTLLQAPYRDSELIQIPENKENQFLSSTVTLHCQSRNSRKLWAGSSSPGRGVTTAIRNPFLPFSSSDSELFQKRRENIHLNLPQSHLKQKLWFSIFSSISLSKRDALDQQIAAT